MASSTVRIREDDKAALARLQEAVHRLTGSRPSQEEILGRALRFVLDKKDEFVLAAAWRPFTDEEFRRLKGLITDMGEWSVQDIDKIVYGDES